MRNCALLASISPGNDKNLAQIDSDLQCTRTTENFLSKVVQYYYLKQKLLTGNIIRFFSCKHSYSMWPQTTSKMNLKGSSAKSKTLGSAEI